MTATIHTIPKPYYFIIRKFSTFSENSITLAAFDNGEPVIHYSIALTDIFELSLFYDYFQIAVKASKYSGQTPVALRDKDEKIIITGDILNQDQEKLQACWYFSFDEVSRNYIYFVNMLDFLKASGYVEYEYKKYTTVDAIAFLCAEFQRKKEDIERVSEIADADERYIFLQVDFSDGTYGAQICRQESCSIEVYEIPPDDVIEILNDLENIAGEINV